MCHSERSEESQSHEEIKTSFSGLMFRFALHDNNKSVKLSMIKIAMVGLMSLFLSGCSVGLFRTNDPVKELQYAKYLYPNEKHVIITKLNADRVEINWRLDNVFDISLSKPCRVKYQRFYFDFIDLIVVPGTLPNGKTYSIWLDTGHPCYTLTTGLTAVENDLAVYPLGKDPGTSANTGICHLPFFQIGNATITNPPCTYLQQQWEARFLGLSVWKQKGLLMGLGLMQHFGYIIFDNERKEVEFMMAAEPFKPANCNQWNAYPLEIENGRLMVTMLIEGRDFSLLFDTCGRYGMVVKEGMWEELQEIAKTTKAKDSKFLSGFLGELTCRRAKIKNLKIENQVVSNAEVLILPENSTYGGANSISMKFFKKSVVVLDFKRKLMWIKGE